MPDDPLVWRAKWIAYAYDPREDIGVFGFRRKLELDHVPASLKVCVSADQRYKLYVNGQFVGFGPQRGDPTHWFFETYDLAPFLKVGENWIAALVWNFGRWAPMAQMSARTGFVLDCGIRIAEGGLNPDGSSEDQSASHAPNPQSAIRNPQSDISTPGGWQVLRLENWSFEMLHSHDPNYYIDVGPGEVIDFRGAPWGWRTGGDSLPPAAGQEAPRRRRGVGGKGVVGWREPHVVCQAEERGAGGGGTPWMLVPRSIPAMRYEPWEGASTARHGFEGDAEPEGAPRKGRQGAKEAAPGAPFPVSLEPGKPVLLDFGELICAYPRIEVEGPPGATLTLTYAESLWGPDGTKGNRDDVAGKRVAGYQDKLILDGQRRTIETLWWRTWRYLTVAVDVECADSSALSEVGATQTESKSGIPMNREAESADESAHSTTLHSLLPIETGYPLDAASSFEADDPWVEKIWDVSLRTARRCAGETYFDCPYWEQLQYVGDARIQALIGYYLGRDRALQRNAVETLGWSLMENGLTQSRYPSRQVQVIPPFSLWWVMMLYDQMLYDSSRPDFVSFQTLNRILGRFRKLMKSDDESQFWMFADWVPEWRWGVPPGSAGSLVHQTLLANAHAAMLSLKAHLEGKPHWPVSQTFWRDYPYLSQYGHPGQQGWLVGARRGATDQTPSEHAEALFRLLGAFHDYDRHKLPEFESHYEAIERWPADALANANAAKCTYYFSYYKHLAMFGRPAGENLTDRTDTTNTTDTTDTTDTSHTSYRSYSFDYLTELQPWKQMIEDGLTTFAENPEPTRSDCHAWSAHPILGFFQIVAGVTSIAPGWKKARIMPHPGSLRRFDARIAHPDGELRVRFEDGKLTVDSPVPFELRWQDKRQEIEAGKAEV